MGVVVVVVVVVVVIIIYLASLVVSSFNRDIKMLTDARSSKSDSAKAVTRNRAAKTRYVGTIRLTKIERRFHVEQPSEFEDIFKDAQEEWDKYI